MTVEPTIESSKQGATSTGSLPIRLEELQPHIDRFGFDPKTASIREINQFVNVLQESAAVEFVRMELGIPGIPLSPIAVEAEIAALRDRQVAHVYTPFDGIPELKEVAAEFISRFLDISVPAECCIPTVGAMQGCFAALSLAGKLDDQRRTVLFIEPSFPTNKKQVQVLGLSPASIDLYDCRGDKLIDAIEDRVAQGDVCAVIWSSPNNPTWLVLDEAELAGIARVCDRHNVVPIEDLAYFGMDTREDYLAAGEPPFQPTILRYTDKAISVISCSKLFGYAGQRIGLTVLSPGFMKATSPGLVRFCGTSNVGRAFISGILYPITACVPASPQYGLLALLKAANAGDRTIFAAVQEYAGRAKKTKQVFLQYGFDLVYGSDHGKPLADGFYFTVHYPKFDNGSDLMMQLLRFGVSVLPLGVTGSCRQEGVRICVSMLDERKFSMLSTRLAQFANEN